MEIVAEIKSRFPGAIIEDGVDQGHPYIKLDASLFREVMQFLRQNHVASFEQLLDVCGVDYMGQTPRFEVVHHLYSLSKQQRLRVRTTVTEEDCKIPSVMDIWPSADWFERETYDMLGIIFEGHPKLERLLMWDDFEGHPLRKDYPLDKRQPLPTPKEVL